MGVILTPTRRKTLARKSGHEDDDEMIEDEEIEDDEDDDEDDDDEDEDDEDTIDLDSAEEEEEDDDDDDDEDEKLLGNSVEDIERRKLFQTEAEEVLENMTLDDVKEVLKENDLDQNLAPRLKKLLAEVIGEGEMESMDDAWDEAIERLEE